MYKQRISKIIFIININNFDRTKRTIFELYFVVGQLKKKIILGTLQAK